MGPIGVQLGGRDADLRAEPELAAVVEAGRRVHQDAARVDLAKPALRVLVAAGADGLGVARAELGDVRERLVQAVDDLDRQDLVEELAPEVGVGRRALRSG